MTDQKLTIPTIHRNGSGKAALLEQYRNAAMAVKAAQQVVQQAWPHGRDYYTQESATINMAILEHESRRRRLQAIYDEFVLLYQEIDKQ